MARDHPDEIPLFPLPSVVLFPYAAVPLFVFEPRYRQMIAETLERPFRRIGMVAVPESHRGDMQDDPPVEPVGCEGEIAHVDQNPDGTYRLLLQGTRRFRIVEERPPKGERLYRVARIETVPDLVEADDRAALRAGRSDLLTLLTELVQRTAPQTADAFRPERFEDVGDEQLVNTLAQAIDLDVHDKQQLLELDRVSERGHMLAELMRFRVTELEEGSGRSSTTVH